MATAAQIKANRHSTETKTEKGKATSRLNALKHGLRAQTGTPVLPHEDPNELEQTTRQWIDDIQPQNALERALVGRAARLAWSLDRAERQETAHRAHHLRKALVRRDARLWETVCEPGQQLFYLAGPRTTRLPGPPWQDHPPLFLRRLEQSAVGCRWLLDRWHEFDHLLEGNPIWNQADQFRFVRLLGKQPLAALNDPALNAIFLAWETLQPGWGRDFWHVSKELTAAADPAYSCTMVWREIAPRPADGAAALAALRAVVDREVSRLEEILAEHEQSAAAEAAELADRAAFDPGPACQRLHQFQAARSRELIRTLDELIKLRRAFGQNAEFGTQDVERGTRPECRVQRAKREGQNGKSTKSYEAAPTSPEADETQLDPKQDQMRQSIPCSAETSVPFDHDHVPQAIPSPLVQAEAGEPRIRTDKANYIYTQHVGRIVLEVCDPVLQEDKRAQTAGDDDRRTASQVGQRQVQVMHPGRLMSDIGNNKPEAAFPRRGPKAR
jgi:hypothetical protein